MMAPMIATIRVFSRVFSRVLLALFLFMTRAAIAGGPPLIVGMEMTYPPFEMTDAEGKPQGVSVDLALALGKALDRPVVFENIAFGGLVPALRTGKIDCIISSMTASEERKRAIDFSDPYVKTGLCLLVGANSGIEKIEDLDQPGRTVTVKIDTTGHLFASRNLKKARTLVLDKETRCALEVAQGKADAFLYDQMSIYAHWRKNLQTTRALLKPFKEEQWAIGIRKGNDKLREAVNRFLAQFRAEGGFEKLGEKWMAQEKAEFRKLDIPFCF